MAIKKHMKKEVKEVHQEVVYRTGRFSIRKDVVVFTDGRQESHEVLQSPEGVLILPLTSDGQIVLTREYRHNHGLTYGVPMGKKEQGDSNPLEAARRELQEEGGLSAKKWTLISTHHNGVHEEGLNYFYIAEELSPEATNQEPDEDIETVEMSFADAFKLMDEGKIIDLTSRACIWAGYVHLLQTGRINNIAPLPKDS